MFTWIKKYYKIFNRQNINEEGKKMFLLEIAITFKQTQKKNVNKNKFLFGEKNIFGAALNTQNRICPLHIGQGRISIFI